jgi:hypothetical protein
MPLKHIRYSDLNSRQREIFNFQKVAAILADYGFNCIKLADDWQGADFLAYHIDGNNTLRVQLKGRLSIDRKYVGKNLFMAFPSKNCWYLVEHDRLVELVSQHANWLNTSSRRSPPRATGFAIPPAISGSARRSISATR